MNLIKNLVVFILVFIEYLNHFRGKISFISSNFILSSFKYIFTSIVLSICFFIFKAFIISVMNKEDDEILEEELNKEYILHLFIYIIIAYIFFPEVAGSFHAIFCFYTGIYIGFHIFRILICILFPQGFSPLLLFFLYNYYLLYFPSIHLIGNYKNSSVGRAKPR